MLLVATAAKTIFLTGQRWKQQFRGRLRKNLYYGLKLTVFYRRSISFKYKDSRTRKKKDFYIVKNISVGVKKCIQNDFLKTVHPNVLGNDFDLQENRDSSICISKGTCFSGIITLIILPEDLWAQDRTPEFS